MRLADIGQRLVDVQFEVEAIAIACLGQQLLGVLGIVIRRLGRRDATDIGGNADAIEHLRDLAAGNNGLRQFRAIDRFHERLADALIHHHLVVGAAGGIEGHVHQQAVMHGRHADIRVIRELAREIRRRVADEIDIAGHELRGLGLTVGDRRDNDGLDRRLPALVVIIVKTRQHHFLLVERHDLVGPARDRAHATVIGLVLELVQHLRIVDVEAIAEAAELGCEPLFSGDPHLVLIDLLDLVDPGKDYL